MSGVGSEQRDENRSRVRHTDAVARLYASQECSR
jgi:hypothetical protein